MAEIIDLGYNYFRSDIIALYIYIYIGLHYINLHFQKTTDRVIYWV